MQERRPPLKFNFTARTTSPYPHAPFMSHSHPFSLLASNLPPDFQIALTHSILKLKSIVIPPHKMSQNGEKNAQVEILIWCILTALRRNLKSPNLLKDPVCKVGVGSVNK